jgi:uncharacterized membrane protein YhhN
MMLELVLLTLAGLSALAYLPLTASAPSMGRSGIKTLPLSLFACVALLGGGPVWLIAGLILSALGDFALSCTGSDTRSDTEQSRTGSGSAEHAFLLGLVSFALAHLCYAIMFWGSVEAVSWPALASLAVLALSTEVWLAPYTGALRGPVRGYVLLICVMTVLALSLPAGLRLASLGAVLFLCSDLILSLQLFRMRRNTWQARCAGYLLWGFYILGQGAILFAVLGRFGEVWGLS